MRWVGARACEGDWMRPQLQLLHGRKDQMHRAIQAGGGKASHPGAKNSGGHPVCLQATLPSSLHD